MFVEQSGKDAKGEWSISKEEFERVVRQLSLEIQTLKAELNHEREEETVKILKDALPCPFCKQPPSRIEDGITASGGWDTGWAVVCDSDGCGATGPVKPRGKKAALTAWNRRSTTCTQPKSR